MARRSKRLKNVADSVHASRIENDICNANRMRQQLKQIPVGAVLMIPTELSDRDGGRERKSPRSMFRAEFKVVAKNSRMMVCQRRNGTCECFTYADLGMLEKQYGGLINGKSE